MADTFTSLDPRINGEMGWLYCPNCGKKIASYKLKAEEPTNVFPYCNLCKTNKKPTKIKQVRYVNR